MKPQIGTFIFIKHYLNHMLLMVTTSLFSIGSYASEDELGELLEMDLEELVTITIASKREEPLSNAPGIISVITADDIRKFGARNLRDILNRQTSFMIVGGHVLPESRSVLRGALEAPQDNQILYLLNGRPIADTQSSNVHVDLFLTFPIKTIEQIEIIRGPGSVLYGSNAFSGIVNIKTKAGTSFDDTISFSYGSFATKSANLQGSTSFAEGWLTGAVHTTDFTGDEFSDIKDLTGQTDNYPMGGQGSSAVFVMDFNNFKVNGYISDAERDNLLADFRFPAEQVRSRRTSINLSHNWDLSENWSFRSHYGYFSDFADLFIATNGLTNEVDGTLHSLEFNLHGQLNQQTNLLLGINPLYSKGDFAEGSLSGDWSTWQIGIFSQIDYQWFDWLKLVGGLQLNRPKELSIDTSPRAGLIFNFKNGLHGKLLYGQAYRNGESINRYFDGSLATANSSLKPETIETYDAQIAYQAEHYHIALTYYHSRITNIHKPVFLPSLNKFQTINSGSVEFDGVELEATWQLTKTLRLITNASYQTNKNNAGINDSTFIPNLMAKLGIAYESPKGFSVALFDNYFDDPTPLDAVTNTAQNNNPKANSHHLVTANLVFNLGKLFDKPQLANTTFSLYIDNLLDEEIFFPNYSTQTVNTSPNYQGRAIYGTIQVTF
ncbi:TonB-dependent receptor plug domain-containing protein [Spartinivicinus poritis]|uniref:TonB-dependent receptor n=1 Tax=Spartinivicinus poritis TaxID=2994640 RepID=A0ABT5U9D6_9GAMM|nr:TonB-dependent receptor [Spartinivicinus sp. A2-2]MDE1462968.1 TonB-dependent receptor [Spartinivicinus sp. A2-2]